MIYDQIKGMEAPTSSQDQCCLETPTTSGHLENPILNTYLITFLCHTKLFRVS